MGFFFKKIFFLLSFCCSRSEMASELKMKIVELEARAEAAEMKLKTAQVGMRKAQQDLEEAQATIKKNEDRVTQVETDN